MVARVRRLVGQKRVGHAGTLDPMASGVLPVLLGRATRLMDLVQSGRKTYVATVALGASTDTDDALGTVLAHADVPPISAASIESVLAQFRGDIVQTPPPYSALKVGGQRAYDLARRGVAVALAARPITIDALTLLAWSSSTLELEVTCSKGTYIRALARDVGVALGTLGHMTALRRTRVGPFAIEDAVSLDQLATLGLEPCLRAARCADQAAPAHTATAAEAARLRNGQPIEHDLLRAGRVWVYDPDGQLLCLASADGTLLRPLLQL